MFLPFNLAPFRTLASSVQFPEESTPKLWDRGCEHFPEQYARPNFAAQNPAMLTTKKDGLLTFMAQVMFFAEKGEDPKSVQKKVIKVIKNGRAYKDWVLPKINEKPGGGSYFVDVLGLEGIYRSLEQHWVLSGPFEFQILWLRKSGTSSLLFRYPGLQQTPKCKSFGRHREGYRIVYRMTPRPDLLEFLIGEAWILPHELGAEAKFRMVAKPAPLVYQLLPEALLSQELEARAGRFFENFIDISRLGYVPSASKNKNSR